METPAVIHGTSDLAARRLTLADAMLLIAASSLILVLLKDAFGLGRFTADPKSRTPHSRACLDHLSVAGGCILFPLAVLVAAIGLGQTLRLGAKTGPGFLACLAVLVAAIYAVAFVEVRLATSHPNDHRIDLIVNFNNMSGRLRNGAAPMILRAWLALALAGRRGPGPNWIDRLGCLIGACFIIIDIYSETYFLIRPLIYR